MGGKLAGTGRGRGSGCWDQIRCLRARQDIQISHINYETSSAE
jgi:hypothetical protein